MAEDFPKDGATFVTEVVERATYRWTRYKPDGARQMGKPGRFQKMVWKGDFFKWENAEPEGYLVQGDVGPLQARDEAILAKDAEIERLKRVVRASKPYVDRAVSDAQKRGAVTMADILVPELIDAALNGGSDAP